MTIDEAIAHAREVAVKQRKDNENCDYKEQYGCKGCSDYYSKSCIECAEEHEQLAGWLEELKQYRASGTVEECRAAIEQLKAAKEDIRKLLCSEYGSSCQFCIHDENEDAICCNVGGSGSWCCKNAAWKEHGLE